MKYNVYFIFSLVFFGLPLTLPLIYGSALSLNNILFEFKNISSTYIQLLKAYRIKFQKFAAHAHKDALINDTFIPT